MAAATVNWVTQASFEPPLVAMGVKNDAHAHDMIKDTKAFALNVLGKDQGPMAFTFFKPADAPGRQDLRRAVPLGHDRRADPRGTRPPSSSAAWSAR